jgi:hypothetical protein
LAVLVEILVGGVGAVAADDDDLVAGILALVTRGAEGGQDPKA